MLYFSTYKLKAGAFTSKGEKVFLQRYNVFLETKDLLFGPFTFEGHKTA